ncbi:MAG: hypothetical protein GWP91_19830, partial [Rhodobacterales bacterium]|nr:hypothetical protein [Rhodobacterales bacterium]
MGRISQIIGVLMDRMGLEDLRFSLGEAKRVMLLLVVCVVTSLLVVDYAEAPSEPLKVGDVASRTVKAPYPIQFVDDLSHEEARTQASEVVLPVFVYQADLGAKMARRVNKAFEAGRVRLAEVSAPSEGREEPTELNETAIKAVVVSFQDALGVHVPDANVHTLLDHGFSESAEAGAVALLARAMDNRVLRDRDFLPADRGGIRIITLRDSTQTEEILTELEALLVPVEAREKVGYGVLEMQGDEREVSAAANIAKALIRPNLSFDPLQTEDRRQEAKASVEPLLVTVKQGATLFQDGDTLNESQIQMYNALQDYKGDSDVGMEIVAVSLMLALMLMSLYAFGSAHLGAFSTANRDVAAVGLLLVLTTALARMMVSVGPQVAAAVSYDAEARSVWFAVPVAGAAMLVRQLLGVGWTWIFAVAASIVCGLVMDFEVLPVL